MKDFKEFLLTETTPHVFDGSMATSLYNKGFYINRSFEELSVTSAEAVKEVTQGFKKAGSMVLRTNTFGASVPKLTEHNIQDRLAEIVQASVKITKEVADDEAYVVGSIGPLGLVLEPLGPTSIEEAEDHYAQMVVAMEEAAVDGYSLESFHDLTELEAAIKAVRGHSARPILAYIGIQENKKTTYGHTLTEFVKLAEKYDVEVIGLCGDVGPSGTLTALEMLRPLTEKPIALLPNAGLPRYVNDQYIYLCNPDYMGKFAKRFVQAGANFVGGHSGVYEEHVKAISNALRMTAGLKSAESKSSLDIQLEKVLPPATDAPVEVVETKDRSKLGARLAAGERVFSIEINSPRGIDFSKFLKHCQALQDGGVEFVNIPDGARAMARMSSTQLSAYVSREFELEPIPHFTTRDRNLLGLQSDLLGAHVNGVRNVLAVTGDPPKLGNCPGASGVYDVDAIGLTHIVQRMNQGLDVGGSSFGEPTQFLIGVALNPTSSNPELETSRFKYKAEAGANFAISQPIYDVDAYKRFFDNMGEIPDVPIIMGIWPLVSLRNAEFLKNEVPGVSVPDWVIAEMEKAGDDKKESLKRGLEISIRTMEAAQDLVSGFQVSAPFNRVSIALEAIHALGK
ncbi:MAG: bifunctional homocysteine S-methyltransferase/methylenetetrahydrofolate reductase [Bdellovibrionales bacterium]|nr:bifunctional homocysteine S-methyltransferase/methylenetetrahydrofolate reductase [Bdellovibrionales bacterium]